MIKYLMGAFFLALTTFIGYGRTTSNYFSGPADSTSITGSNTVCEGSGVLLTAKYAAAGSTYAWQQSVNGGTTWESVGDNNANYTATATGKYRVQVTDNLNNMVTWPSVEVKVNPKPVADFNFSNNNTCSGTNIQFTSSINNGTAPYSYSWDFGDASALSTMQNPTHAYSSLGCGTVTFSGKLVVTDANGCSNSVTKPITVKQAPDVQLSDENTFSPFKNCDNNPTPANPNYTITVTNSSPSASCISSYTLDWGDGSPLVNNPVFPLTHTYTKLGAFNIVFTGVGSNGCSYSKTYLAANQSNPDIGIATFGSTIGCASLPVSSIITTWQSNSPGTTYSLSFGDGTVLNLTHPLKADLTNDTIYHTYITSPCPSPTYQLSITATNGCKSKSFIGGDIEVRTKPSPKFSVPQLVYCVNQSICLNNQTTPGYYANCATTTNYSWDFGDGSPVSTSANPCHSYSAPGIYTITLTSSNPCGSGTYTQQVCIVGSPTSSFTTDKTQGCAPLTVTAINNSDGGSSCTTETYKWSIAYSPGNCGTTRGDSFANGTTSTSENPSFTFTTPGSYTITLAVTNACGTSTSTKTVVVKSPPTISLAGVPNACSSITLTPTASVVNCGNGTLGYQWTFNGGTPGSSTSLNPGPITFSTTGINSIVLNVTNECGTGTATQNFGINPAPDLTVPSDAVVCGGKSIGVFSFSSSVSGTTFSWTNNNTSIGLAASGSGSSIPAFTPVNNSATPVIATITVIATKGGCPTTKTFTITVNPKPVAPTITSELVYCLNETATALTATATGANTLNWYTNSSLTGGTTTAPTPNTAAAGTSTYYVTQSNTYGCQSPAATIDVTVHPKITGNTIGSDQTICTGFPANSLSTQSTVSGGDGSYGYGWQQSTDGGVIWNTIPSANAANYSPGILNTTTKFRRYINSSNCSDTSNAVTITIQGTLTNINIATSQTICSGSVPALLTGQTPNGGDGSFTYVWESSLDNAAWNPIPNTNRVDYQPSSLTATTYYRRKTLSGPCSGYSSVVIITVNPIPSVNTIADKVYCSNSSVNTISFTSNPSTGVSYAWTNDNTSIGLVASGTGALPLFTATNTNNPKTPAVGIVSVTPTYTSNNVSCPGSSTSFKIVVLPTITIAPINDTSVCTGITIPSFTPVVDAGNYSGSSVTYSWTVSGSGISLTNGTGPNIPSIITDNPGTTDLVAMITITPVYNYGGVSCNGTPTSYKITTKPGTPKSNAGPDAELCAATTYTLQANQPPNVTGVWSQYGANAATITTPSSSTTSITDLVPGNTYYLVWTVSGFASCPSSKDTVVIRTDNEVVNTINNTTQTICVGQPVTISGDAPIGGNGIYQYSWQQSTDNVSWVPILGQNLSSLTFSPLQTAYVKRTVSSLPCTKESSPTQIIVQPALSNNNISADQSICINRQASIINGSTPTGGNGSFTFNWQQSTDGGITWQDIPASNAKDYDPGVLTVTTKFRRFVNTDLCYGPQASTSNVITITVNPDAKAVFNPTATIGCVPFTLTPSIISLQTYPAQNSQYVWFADNVLIGSGSIFPEYTINQSDDTVTIKLVAVSMFGCKNDSVSHQFITHKVPQPDFNLSHDVGCGPLGVTISNTTPDIASFTYQWNFGNGQTSALDQPGMITFLPNPSFGDTTYKITLSVASACQTIPITKSVIVKSKPKALFTPNNSVGCSPMTVTFNNTSKGINNSYVWDFGDGSAPLSASATGTIQHTFITGAQDTLYVKLVAMNECGNDTLQYAIVVSPNQIHLDFAINGNEFSGCSPHTVKFINNTSGASAFTWNFGDGNVVSTTKNVDTVSHTYLLPGTYSIVLHATNGCSDTTSTETVVIYPTPVASYSADQYTMCIGEPIAFTNKSTGANSYLWQFGDGSTSTLNNPIHAYTAAGIYDVKLIVYSFNVSGTVCTDSSTQQVQVVTTMKGSFLASDTVSNCSPFTVTFTNQNIPSVTASWDFGDGTTASGDITTHTFTKAGTYIVTLTVQVPGGCTYITTKTIKVLGPAGSWTHTTGYLCNNATANFKVLASNTDSYTFDFGDGVVLTSNANSLFHSYANGGVYYPSVTLKNNAGCAIILKGIDSIRVDKIKAGFTATQQNLCGSTLVNFTDTSHAFFGKQSVKWNFGDGTTSTSFNNTHTYTSSGIYPVQLIVFGNSGCSDTITKQLNVQVYSVPKATILTSSTGCERIPVLFNTSVQSNDAIGVTQWGLSNGVTDNHALFNYTFPQNGSYNIQLIVGTVYGCYDTAYKSIQVNPTPTVTASNDISLCRGNSAPLAASGIGVSQWSWQPLTGLSCYDCTDPVASPIITTPYVIQASNNFGCSAYDTVVVTVIQPLHMKVSPSDSICIGESTNLLVSGASSYTWSPGIGLNNTTISNPTASPIITTTYRVVGYDGYNCFTDTAFITVGVGQYPTVSLGPDQTLATGTKLSLTSLIQNGPIAKWLWSPATDLSCANCPLPVAEVKKDISYLVKVTTAYGCSATDTISIKAFCQNAQVFIPNAFTPNGDGYNDILMVRASGIALVKSFRIFNRWGEVVFEKGNFAPNDAGYGWDGKIKGIVGGPDVFVYTAEVVCENGTPYTYKGNVSILK